MYDHVYVRIYICIYICWKHLCHNGYCCKKWSWQPEFKSWMMLFAFHTLRKGINLTILPPSLGK